MIVSGYHPKSVKFVRRNVETETRHVLTEEGLNERPSPLTSDLVVAGEIGFRKSTAEPKAVAGFHSHHRASESAPIDEVNSPCERFGGSFYQFRRGTSQDQKAGVETRSVGKHSQNRKKARITLEFVDNDQPMQSSEDITRILQSRPSNYGNYFDLEDPVVVGLLENCMKPTLRNCLFDSISY